MTGLRRALFGLAALAFVFGHRLRRARSSPATTQSPRGLATALILLAGWGFAGTGLYAWYRRPDDNVGPLMTAIGFTWFFQALGSSNNERRLRDRHASAARSPTRS